VPEHFTNKLFVRLSAVLPHIIQLRVAEFPFVLLPAATWYISPVVKW